MYIYNTNNQGGFILVAVLFFLLMIALMSLSLLNASHLELRMSQNYAMASQQFWAAEAGLKVAEAQLGYRLLNEHWQDAFNYAGYHVQYEVKRMGLPICSNLNTFVYYRIIAQAKQPKRNALTLQTTYVKNTYQKCNVNQRTQLVEGRSSWRELNNVN